MDNNDLLFKTILNKLETLDEKYEKIANSQHYTNISVEKLRSEVKIYSTQGCPRNPDIIEKLVVSTLATKGIIGESARRKKTKDTLLIAVSIVTLVVAIYNAMDFINNTIPAI